MLLKWHCWDAGTQDDTRQQISQYSQVGVSFLQCMVLFTAYSCLNRGLILSQLPPPRSGVAFLPLGVVFQDGASEWGAGEGLFDCL